MVNRYKVHFQGCSCSFKIIEADSMKEAKQIFAKQEGIRVGPYIKASKY